jgi:putative transposase
MTAKTQSGQGELDFTVRTWGGKRHGAGRKKNKLRRDPEHRSRPRHRRYDPLHVVLRTRKDVGRLRRGPTYHAIRRALLRVADRSTFRVVHLSIQHNHLHFLVEAEDKLHLSRGMQALTISAAKAINASLGRTGKVFEYRYHATPITNPRQARHALAYVLNNWRRHQEDFTTPGAEQALLDPYSSAIAFDGWKARRFEVPEGYAPLPVSRPQTWMLAVGWREHGAIDVREIPGPLR